MSKGYWRLTLVCSFYAAFIFPVIMLCLMGRPFYQYNDAGDIAIGSFFSALIGFIVIWLLAYIIKLIILPSIRYVRAGFRP